MTKLICVPALLLALGGTTLVAAPRAQKAITKTVTFAGKSKATFQSSDINFFFSDVPANQAVNGRDLNAFAGATLPEKLVSELGSSSEGDNQENLYQLTQVYDRLDTKVSGQVVAYHNRSDDTDVNLSMVVGKTAADKLKPNTTYLITAKLSFYTNVSSELFGVGGSADSNSFGLAVSQSPWVAQIPSGQTPTQPTTPTEPTNPGQSDDGLNSYYGIAAKFFVESDELADLADAAYSSFTAEELKTVSTSTTKATVVKALTALYTKVLGTLPKGDKSTAVNTKISAELDALIKSKLNAMSEEEKQQLKDMFGSGGGPVMLMAAPSASVFAAAETSSSEAILRTFTKDSNGKTRALGVPSGTCNAGTPLNMMDADDRWVCERYSYMGRINNGLDGSHAWALNSVSTQKALEFTTDASGSPLYLNLNSHSGFEGLTVYYVTGVEYKVVEKK